MLYVTKGTIAEPLNSVESLEINEEVNGEFVLSMTSFDVENNHGYHLLTVESIITIEDYEFSIKEVKQTSYSKEVIAISIFFNLNDKRQNEIYGGTRSFDEFAQFVFKGTNWNFTSTVQGHEMIPNFGENNVVALVQQLCTVFKCEYQIMPNNHIHFSNKIGGDYDAQYRYKQNVVALSRHENTSNLKTYIEGYGADKLWVSYTSPYAEKFGKREAEPVHDDRFTHADALLEHIKASIQDEPELSFELDAVELTNKELGERVWLIHEPLDIELQTRILQQTKTLVDGELKTSKVVLGNMIPKDFIDILVNQKIEMDNNKDIVRSKFHQTNDRITMEVERVGKQLTQLQIEDGKISAKVDEANKSIAELTLTSEQFKVSINNKVDNMSSDFTIRADRIESNVRDVGSKADRAESNITQTNSYIQTQVVKYNEGEKVVSMINQTPDYVQIQAKSINLDGAVIASGSITGRTNINVGTDLYVGSDIYMDYGRGQNNQIHFYPGTQIYNSSSDLFVQADSTLWLGGQYVNLQGQVSFSQAQSVDFSGVYVTGLNVEATSINGLNIRANWSGHNKNASEAGRLYVDGGRYALLYQG
ncbi:phage tail protein [Lysinibacillus sp. NPDC086135]|uniref:phage tail protein n=1 Tax=Lysinibacillus sp. NPDC086135 TaxID=3364130 RepID=UPI003822B744